ncbi:hypothetical protein G6F44_013562 [Rhizopus delemar]|nr:hypothetical protein G6F44_013562 [Rhizopus delemar]
MYFLLSSFLTYCICGDFNARLGDLTDDALVSPRGAAMARWLADRSLTVLNGPLAHGIPTWVGFRDDREMSSIIDMFLTNASLLSPRLDIASDLSLGSDHRLLTLSFSFAQSSYGTCLALVNLIHVNCIKIPFVHPLLLCSLN